jgi:DNA (cytosine-5)-methyltransferase 1
MDVPDDLAIFRKSNKKRSVHDAIADLIGAKSLGCDDNGYDLWSYDRRRQGSPYARTMEASDNCTGHGTTLHTRSPLKRFSQLAPGERDPVGKYARLSWDGLCPTLRAGTGNDRGSYQAVRPIHPAEDRVITPREAARLQGFPDSFVFHPTVWHSCRMIGNSVSPILAKKLMQRIAKCL